MFKRFLKIHAAVCSLVVLLVCAGFGFASIQTDGSFGDDGIVLKDFNKGDDEVFSLALQDDGKILAVGYSNNGAVNNLAVVRFLANGTVDSTFGESGATLLSFGSGETVGNSLVSQSDETILVAGVTEDGGKKAFVAALTSGGVLDDTFGDNGKRLVAVAGETVIVTDVIVAEDDTIYLVTVSKSEGSKDSSRIIKMSSSGKLDDTFGTDGIAQLEIDEDVGINAISLLSDGDILAAGYCEQGDGHNACLLLFDDQGAIDQSFGDNGIVRPTFEGEDSQLLDIVSLGEKIFAITGYANNGTYNETFVAKVDSSGAFVTDFAANGVYRSTLQFENIAYAANVNDTGEIQVVGLSDDGSGKDVFVLTVAETAENVLSVNYLTVDISNKDDVAYSVASVSADKLLVAGSAENGDNKDFVLMSLTSSDSAQSSSGSLADGIVAAGYKLLTNPLSDITRVSVTSGGFISQYDPEAAEITQRGVCYSVHPNPEYTSDEDSTDSDSTDTTDDTDSTGSTSGVFPDDRSSSYIVKKGQTDDGDGVGSYTSEIEDITPGTKYYLRAYAVLDDDTVIYGNEIVFKTEDACFIATAAYGSILDKHVVVLREFRDRFLAGNHFGQKFIGSYYKYSPGLAAIIEEHEFLATGVRFILVPIIGVAFLLLNLPLFVSWLVFGAVPLLLLFTWRLKEGNMKKRGVLNQRGFTLIELLVVLVIIGILAGYIGPKIMGRPEEAKRVKAELQIQGLETALKLYKLDNGMYPTTEQGLQALIEPPSTGKLAPKWREGGYLDKGKLPLDPWGYSFAYLSPGLNDDFDLSSYGGDGELGGEGDAQDINNWEIE